MNISVFKTDLSPCFHNNERGPNLHSELKVLSVHFAFPLIFQQDLSWQQNLETLLTCAWNFSPRLAVQLTLRAQTPGLQVQLFALIRKEPARIAHIPEAFDLLMSCDLTAGSSEVSSY